VDLDLSIEHKNMDVGAPGCVAMRDAIGFASGASHAREPV
jgi:hypothetical protein